MLLGGGYYDHRSGSACHSRHGKVETEVELNLDVDTSFRTQKMLKILFLIVTAIIAHIIRLRRMEQQRKTEVGA